MGVEVRQAALCLIRRGNAILVCEIIDPATGTILTVRRVAALSPARLLNRQ